MCLVGYYEVYRYVEQICCNVVLGVGLFWVGLYVCREKMKIEGIESVIVWWKCYYWGFCMQFNSFCLFCDDFGEVSCG